MAVPANTYTRYTAGNNVREDIIDIITNTEQTRTPVLSSFGTDTADQTYHEWSRDTYRAPNKDNAALDGDDAIATAIVPPVRVGNHCQIFTETVRTSRRANRVKKIGMKRADTYYIAKAMKSVHRDIEAMTLSNNVAVAGSGPVQPKSAGLGVLIYTNVNHGAGGSTPPHTSGAATVAPTAGTARPFTEALLKDVCQKSFVATGEVPRMVACSPNHKQTFSGFTGIAVNRYQVGKKEQGRIVGGADIYMSDFGELEIVPHYMMAGSSTVYGLNTEYGEAVYLDGFKRTPLGIGGDSTAEQIIADVTLRAKAENVHFKIADLTP